MALGIEEIVRRFGFRRPTARTISAVEENRHRVIEYALYLDETLPDGREKDLALTALQQCAMWANYAVTHDHSPEDELPHDLPPDSMIG